jgi:hypothetical protein
MTFPAPWAKTLEPTKVNPAVPGKRHVTVLPRVGSEVGWFVAVGTGVGVLVNAGFDVLEGEGVKVLVAPGTCVFVSKGVAVGEGMEELVGEAV